MSRSDGKPCCACGERLSNLSGQMLIAWAASETKGQRFDIVRADQSRPDQSGPGQAAGAAATLWLLVGNGFLNVQQAGAEVILPRQPRSKTFSLKWLCLLWIGVASAYSMFGSMRLLLQSMSHSPVDNGR